MSTWGIIFVTIVTIAGMSLGWHIADRIEEWWSR